MSELFGLVKKIIEEFPNDQEEIKSLFEERNFLKLINFLDSNQTFEIDSGKVKFALEGGNAEGLLALANSNIEKEARVEKLFKECVQLWKKQL